MSAPASAPAPAPAPAPALRLTYFAIPARAFPIRFALRCAGVAFEDERITREELLARRGGGSGGLPSTSAAIPLGQVPVLYVDGQAYTESVPLSRWAARRSALYPADELAALASEEAVAALDEAWSKLPRHLEAAALREARGVWVAEVAPKYLRRVAARVEASGGPFVLGGALSWADAWVCAFAEQLERGVYDHVPRDLLAGFPPLAALVRAFKAHPLFAAHGAPM